MNHQIVIGAIVMNESVPNEIKVSNPQISPKINITRPVMVLPT